MGTSTFFAALLLLALLLVVRLLLHRFRRRADRPRAAPSQTPSNHSRPAARPPPLPPSTAPLPPSPLSHCTPKNSCCPVASSPSSKAHAHKIVLRSPTRQAPQHTDHLSSNSSTKKPHAISNARMHQEAAAVLPPPEDTHTLRLPPALSSGRPAATPLAPPATLASAPISFPSPPPEPCLLTHPTSRPTSRTASQLQPSPRDGKCHVVLQLSEGTTNPIKRSVHPRSSQPSVPLPNNVDNPSPPTHSAHQEPLLLLPLHSASSPSLPHLSPAPSCSSMDQASSSHLSLPGMSPSARSSPSRSSTLQDKARHLLTTLSIGSTSTAASSATTGKVQRGMHKAAKKAAGAASAVMDSAKAAIARIGSKISSDEAIAPAPPRVMISGKDGDKRAVFRNNKVSPTPVFFAVVHPRTAATAAATVAAPAASTPSPPQDDGCRHRSTSCQQPHLMSPDSPSASEIHSPVHDVGTSSSGTTAAVAADAGPRSGTPAVLALASPRADLPSPPSSSSSSSGNLGGQKRPRHASSLTPLQLDEPSSAASAALGDITRLHLPSAQSLALCTRQVELECLAPASIDTLLLSRSQHTSMQSQTQYLPTSPTPRLPSTLDLCALSNNDEIEAQSAASSASAWLHPPAPPSPPSSSPANIWSDPWHRSMGLPMLSPCTQQQQQPLSPAAAAAWGALGARDFDNAAAGSEPGTGQLGHGCSGSGILADARYRPAGISSARPNGSGGDSGSGGGSFGAAVDFELILKGSGSWDAIASLLEQERSAGTESGTEDSVLVQQQRQQQQQQRRMRSAFDAELARTAAGPAAEHHHQMLQMLQYLLAPEAVVPGLSPSSSLSAPEHQHQHQHQQQLDLYALLQQWQDSTAGQVQEQAGPRASPAAAFPQQQQHMDALEPGPSQLPQQQQACSVPPPDHTSWSGCWYMTPLNSELNAGALGLEQRVLPEPWGGSPRSGGLYKGASGSSSQGGKRSPSVRSPVLSLEGKGKVRSSCQMAAALQRPKPLSLPPSQPPMLMPMYSLFPQGFAPGQVLAGLGGIPLVPQMGMLPSMYMQYAVQDGRGNVVLVPVSVPIAALPMQHMRRLPEMTPLTTAVVQVKHAGALPPCSRPLP